MQTPTVMPFPDWTSKVGPHTVTFVRHGEKAGPGFRADLTQKGYFDSVEAGKRISYSIDLFIASPSPRTISTARGIRAGNSSSAPLITEEQLAEPGLGLYNEFAPAMKSFLSSIQGIIESEGAEVVIATTHNYVVDYVSSLPGCRHGFSDLLCGITLNLEHLFQLVETL